MDDKQQSQPHDIMWLYLQRQNNKNFDVVEAVSTIINELTYLQDLELWQKRMTKSILADLTP